MKTSNAFKMAIATSVCLMALVVAVGCSGASSSSTSSASSSAATASSTTASASSASASAASTASHSASASAASASQASTSASAASASQASTSASATSATSQNAVDAALQEGYQVFEGTARVGDAEAIIKLQGKDIDPAMIGNDNGTYAVVVFDSPAQVTGMSGDGSGQRTQSAAMIGVAEHSDYGSFVAEYGNLDEWKALDGQHVTIAVKADKVMFPSDVRLPIAEPSASEVVVL